MRCMFRELQRDFNPHFELILAVQLRIGSTVDWEACRPLTTFDGTLPNEKFVIDPRRPSMRFWLLILTGLVIVVPATAQDLRKLPPEKAVQLTIDFGDGVQKTFSALEWKEKQTVLDVLQLAEKHPRGIKLKHRGSGATTLVTAIDDAANQAGGDNWTYEVNGKRADRSCGVFEVQAGDKVLWKYGSLK